MNRILLAGFFVLLFLPTANALPGFFENFIDGNDATTPTAEPVAWFTGSQSPMFENGALKCYITSGGTPTCGGSTPVISMSLQAGYTAVAIDWTLSFSAQAKRMMGATGAFSGGLTVITAGGVERNIGGIGVNAGACPACQDVASCGAQAPTQFGTGSEDESDSWTATYVHSTTTLTVTAGHCSYSAVNAGYDTVTGFNFGVNACCNGVTGHLQDDVGKITSLVWNPAGNSGTYTLPTTPRAPTGLLAQVIEGWTGTESKVRLSWPVSQDDPDQSGTGSLVYKVVFVPAGSASSTVTDATDADDGLGHRALTITEGGTLPLGVTVFYVVAVNQGLQSSPSCTATVDDHKQGQSATCGTVFCAGCTGTGSGTTPADVGSGIVTFAQSIGFVSTGSLFFFGLIIVVVCMLAVAAPFAAITKSLSPVPGAVGGLGGMLFNTFTGVWEPWAGVVLIILAAAVVVVAARGVFASGGGSA